MCFGGGLQCRDASGAVSWHVPSQYGDTALMAAASRGHRDTAELLLDRGADVEAENHVKTAIGAQLAKPLVRQRQAHRSLWNQFFQPLLSFDLKGSLNILLAVVSGLISVVVANGAGCSIAGW
tara:strand:- start:347 stop:715 length:369 start_codon:yes stop_codon:yes gene_type:complete